MSSLEDRVERSGGLENLKKEQIDQLSRLKADVATVMNVLKDEDKDDLDNKNDVQQLIQKYSDKETVIRNQMDNQKAWYTSRRAELQRLKEEGRFHRIQRRMGNLQSDRKELEQVINSFNALVAYGESVRTIHKVVESQLNEQLAHDIPRVSQTLSKAFTSLTEHQWYDRLVISQSALPKLELRVSSSQDPTGREDPTGVLNGAG